MLEFMADFLDGDLRVFIMYYRNGREAKNGDEIVQLDTDSAKINGAGVLIRAVPGYDFCNGIMANDRSHSFLSVYLCDCLHVEDVGSLLSEKGLGKRPQLLRKRPHGK